MNHKLLADALRKGDSEPVHLEINVKDYVVEGGATNYTSMYANVDKEILSKYDGPSAASSSSKKPRFVFPPVSRIGGGDRFPGPGAGVYRTRFPRFIPVLGGDDRFPGPVAGVYPTRGDFGGSGSGSMFVGPNYPRFFGGVGREPRMPGGLPGVVPPGARFDPYGPPGIPGFEPNRFVRELRRPGRGTHPDLELFRNDSLFI